MKILKIRRGFTEIKILFELAVKNNCIICGGYARYCASPQSIKNIIPAKDVDLFPRTEESCANLLKDLRQLGFKIKYENKISYTMEPKKKNVDSLNHIPTPQIIKPVKEGHIVSVGTMEEILNNFDFTVVRAGIISETEVMVDDDFEVDEFNKKLQLKNIHCPISSTLRCIKYSKKGYFLGPMEALKLFQDWDRRGDEYKKNMIELFGKSKKGKKSEDNPAGMTAEDIDELESLLRID
jgi:hypothetical protein